MYEENRKISWTNIFIKGIIVIIFVLFTVWLLSLSNRDLSNSLDVLTDNIFSENIERMKNVGKEYFTIERLPSEIGDVKVLSLSKMYDEKLILELKDKNGNACSAKNSYVSVEKLENEYQMKVYLECDEKNDYIIVIMGCYDYCDTDICEIKEETIEYEYKKTFGGSWSNWGNWSEWSKVSVTKNNYRDVESKVVDEKYTYEVDVTETVYTQEASCPTIDGYTLESNKSGKCSYSKAIPSYEDPVCPTLNGYTLTVRDGFACSYSKTTSSYEDPVCPTLNGYTFVGRNKFMCSYSKTTSSYEDPICPTLNGYTFVGRNGFNCSYSQVVTGSTYTLQYYSTGSGSYVPADTNTYHYELTSSDYVYDCNNSCSFKWSYTYKIYKKVYDKVTNYDTKTASCPSGYNQSGNKCVKYTTLYDTKTASCPIGYNQLGSKCVKYSTLYDIKTANCPIGYSQSGNKCVKYSLFEKTEDAICPIGEYINNEKCYKDVLSKTTVESTKKVTYYRYRLRSYTGGSVDYKWSTSNSDKKLLDDGYVLTGRTR